MKETEDAFPSSSQIEWVHCAVDCYTAFFNSRFKHHLTMFGLCLSIRASWLIVTTLLSLTAIVVLACGLLLVVSFDYDDDRQHSKDLIVVDQISQYLLHIMCMCMYKLSP